MKKFNKNLLKYFLFLNNNQNILIINKHNGI